MKCGVSHGDLEGEHLNRLSIEQGRLLPTESSLGRGVENDVEHGAVFAGGMGELEFIRMSVTAVTVNQEGGAGFFVVDVAHEFDQGVLVFPVAVAGGIDGVIGDFSAEEVWERVKPTKGALPSAFDHGLDLGVSGRRDGICGAGDDESAVDRRSFGDGTGVRAARTGDVDNGALDAE